MNGQLSFGSLLLQSCHKFVLIEENEPFKCRSVLPSLLFYALVIVPGKDVGEGNCLIVDSFLRERSVQCHSNTSLLSISPLCWDSISSHLMHEATEHKGKEELGISGVVFVLSAWQKGRHSVSPSLPFTPCSPLRSVFLGWLADPALAVVKAVWVTQSKHPPGSGCSECVRDFTPLVFYHVLPHVRMRNEKGSETSKTNDQARLSLSFYSFNIKT